MVYLACLTANAQPYPQNYFRNPLGVPLQLAANFGEVRNNHYHMGFDLRTQQRENLPVYAAAAGYISRIKVERYGYGRAIYITHPNGYTTVYAHLNRFYDTLEQRLQLHQYANKSWSQEINFATNEFPVVQGQYIGLSGNTGASGGPHLHFEIRDSKTGNCLNPRLFGFEIPDAIPPTLFGLYWYNRHFSTYAQTPMPIRFRKTDSGYYGLDTVRVSSKFSLGVHAEDKSSNSPFYFGIYQAHLTVNEVPYFAFTLNNFSYDSTRYSNGCIDYPFWIRHRKPLQHISQLPGVSLPIFNDIAGKRGIIYVSDTTAQRIQITLSDASGNSTNVHLIVRYDSSANAPLYTTQQYEQLSPQQPNKVGNGLTAISFNSQAFYDTVPFVFGQAFVSNSSSLLYLHDPTIPVHSKYAVQVPVPMAAQSFTERLLFTLRSGGYTQYAKANVAGKLALAEGFNKLGTLTLTIDTTPPTVQPISWKADGTLYRNATLRLRLSDTQSDVLADSVLIDSTWQPFAYQNNDVWWKLPESFTPGLHNITIYASDIVGNKNVITLAFNYSNEPAPTNKKKKKSVTINRKTTKHGTRKRK
jgi:murein DD-endopeptidase MepM/ murein hydrolase activator NlpD